MTEFLTAVQLAERLGVRPCTIRLWAREGWIPKLRISGKVVRFDADAVEAALRARAAKGRADA